MPRIFYTSMPRRYKFPFVTVLLVLPVSLLVYTVHSTNMLIQQRFAWTPYIRLFPYRNACALNFTLGAWNFDDNATWDVLDDKMACSLEPGGRYKPEHYDVQKDIVIVIPFRDREEQLKTFMRYMHPYLQHKQLAYRIVVVEMTPGVPFNRALLFNVGFVETVKVTDQQCFIFHDVDLLPENTSNPYTCERSPLHMSSAIDTFKYKLSYATYFGGVCALKKEHFQRLNGLSNLYFGWGAEDDDFFSRVILSNYTISRLSRNEGRYHALSHPAEKKNPHRVELLNLMKTRRSVDGLNSLNSKYNIVKIEFKPLYTWILVEVNATNIRTYKYDRTHKNENVTKTVQLTE